MSAEAITGAPAPAGEVQWAPAKDAPLRPENAQPYDMAFGKIIFREDEVHCRLAIANNDGSWSFACGDRHYDHQGLREHLTRPAPLGYHRKRGHIVSILPADTVRNLTPYTPTTLCILQPADIALALAAQQQVAAFAAPAAPANLAQPQQAPVIVAAVAPQAQAPLPAPHGGPASGGHPAPALTMAAALSGAQSHITTVIALPPGMGYVYHHAAVPVYQPHLVLHQTNLAVTGVYAQPAAVAAAPVAQQQVIGVAPDQQQQQQHHQGGVGAPSGGAGEQPYAS